MTKAVSPSFFLFIFTSVLLELTNYGFSYCKFSSVAVNSAKSNFPISASTFCFADTAIIFICFIMFHLLLGCTSWQKISIIHEIKKNGEFCLCISQWDCCEHYSSKSLKLLCLPSPAVAQLHLLCMCVKMKLSQSCLTLCDSSVNLYVSLLPKPQVPFLPKHRWREQTYRYRGEGRGEEWIGRLGLICISSVCKIED